MRLKWFEYLAGLTALAAVAALAAAPASAGINVKMPGAFKMYEKHKGDAVNRLFVCEKCGEQGVILSATVTPYKKGSACSDCKPEMWQSTMAKSFGGDGSEVEVKDAFKKEMQGEDQVFTGAFKATKPGEYPRAVAVRIRVRPAETLIMFANCALDEEKLCYGAIKSAVENSEMTQESGSGPDTDAASKNAKSPHGE